MSTRGNISVKIPSEMMGKTFENIHGNQVRVTGEYMTIYNHHDSYPEGLGQTLLDYYKSFEVIFVLILGGSTSSVRETPGDCDYYASSEGWSGNEPIFTDTPPRISEEYLYIFESGRWYVYSRYGTENGPLEDYISPSFTTTTTTKNGDMILLPKNFCYYLHGYLSGLLSTQREEDKGLDSIIKTLEGYLNV